MAPIIIIKKNFFLSFVVCRKISFNKINIMPIKFMIFKASALYSPHKIILMIRYVVN